MRKIVLLSFLILTILIILSCERDDICPASTPTTPNLIVEFYDIANQESVKFVPQIRVQGINNNGVLDGYQAANVDDLILPLRTDTTATQYSLRRDYSNNDNGTPDDPSDDSPNGNEDIITIKYSAEQVFVSRACGYKTVFRNVTLTIEPDSDNWILSRQSVTDNQSVEDETTAHFYLFF